MQAKVLNTANACFPASGGLGYHWECSHYITIWSAVLHKHCLFYYLDLLPQPLSAISQRKGCRNAVTMHYQHFVTPSVSEDKYANISVLSSYWSSWVFSDLRERLQMTSFSFLISVKEGGGRWKVTSLIKGRDLAKVTETHGEVLKILCDVIFERSLIIH